MKQLLLLFLLFTATVSKAQKSSPIVGDAATLIDLLNKDYNSINPETWDDEINADRGKAISILKSYLLEIHVVGSSPAENKIKIAYGEYIKAKEKVNAVSKININVYVQNIEMPMKDGKPDPGKKIIESHHQYKDFEVSLMSLQDSLKKKKDDYYLQKKESDDVEFDKLRIGFSTNTYLEYMVDLFKEKYNNVYYNAVDRTAQNNTYASIQKSIPFIGGDLGFETIIDGLSRFLAKRIKEELTIHAIDKIKNYLENPTPENYCHELLVLLPNTTNYLKSFESNQLLNFTDEMKQYIEQDFNDLLTNAVNLRNTPRLKKYIAKYPDLEFAFEGLEIIPQLSKIKTPVDYFEMVENSRCLAKWRSNEGDKTRYNIAQSMRLASMIAYSMTVVENGETKFASVDMISNYGSEINFFFLYFGMLHQQNIKYFKIAFIPSTSASPVPLDIARLMAIPMFTYGNLSETVDKVRQLLKENLVAVAANAEKIYTEGLALKKKKKNNEEIKYQELYSFIDNFISFAEEVVTTGGLLFGAGSNFYESPVYDDFNLKYKLEPYFNVARIANTIVLDLHQKKYSNAIIKAIEIPYNFRTEGGNFTKNLMYFSNQIKLNDNLSFLKEVFDEKTFKGLDEKEKIQKLKDIHNKLEILSIRMSTDPALGGVIIGCNNFMGYIKNLNAAPATRTSIANLSTEINNLKSIIERNDVSIMNFEGITRIKVNEYVSNLLKSTGYPTGIETSISDKMYEYLRILYNQQVLNKTTNSADEEEAIKSIINAFAPQSLHEDSKVKDNNAIKVIHFVNEMAGAKDAEEVEKAIEAFALPVGSSSLKEKAASYFSINAYPGLIGGLEYAKEQETAGTFGFTAPVGLYAQFFSWGNGSSLGAFVPVIDIGAPVRLRIDGDSDNKTLPDFNFNDIFSPGFYLSYGFGKKLPLAINLGAQYGPKLRDVKTDTEGKFTAVDSYRISIALVIDIPLFTISGKY